MKKIHFTFLCLVAFILNVQAQYVFNSCGSRPVYGDSLTGILTQFDTTGVTSGSSGANITWNYTNLISSFTVPISHHYFDPSTIADTVGSNTNIFPTADLADSVANGVYSYYQHASDSVSYLGDYRDAYDYQISKGPEKQSMCPFNFENSFHTSFAQYNLGMCSFNSFMNKIVTYDAYGTLNLGSTSYDVARVRILEYRIDSSNCSPTPIITYSEDTTYVWLDTQTGLPVFSWEYHNDTSGHYITKNIESYSYSHAPVTLYTSVQPLAAQQSELNVYPNPSNGVFQIQASSQQLIADSQIEIYNMMGEKVYEQAISDKGTANSNGFSLIPVNLNCAPNGIYFLQLKTEQGMTTQKIIIN